MLIDLHAATVVERDARFFQTETLGVGNAADRDQHDIGFDLFGSPARRRLNLRDERLARSIDAGDLGAKLEREALLLEHTLKLSGDLAVHARQDAIEKLHHRHLRTEPVPHRAKLEPDHAGADDQQLARYLGERERAGRRHDALLVDLDALQPRDIRAGGDDDVLGFHHLRLAVFARHLDFPGAEYPPLAADDVDLVLLHQELDALDVAINALLLEIHHRGQIEFRRG